MTGGFEIWRQRLGVWVPAALFCLANLVAFGVYQLGYAGNEQSLQVDIDSRKAELKKLQSDRGALETLIGRADANRREVGALYERFSTRRQRLTEVIAEVENLARKAGLDPRSIAFPETEVEDYGLVKRSFVFSVEGNYLDLRKFLNLLELSESFLTLEDATLGESSKGPELRVNLTLSTFFAKERPKLPGAAS